MMFFEYFNVTLVAVVVTFVATLVFSQKIKDFLAGVPAEFRASMSKLEASIKADVSKYEANLVAKVSSVPAPPAPPAPKAPAAPTA